jgi:predicted Zn-dependent peptidase
MFLHILKYNFISALRVKQLNFWILIFPIILGTLFNIAFSGIMDSEKFKTIPVAIVEKSENKNFSSVVSQRQIDIAKEKLISSLIMSREHPQSKFSSQGRNLLMLLKVIEDDEIIDKIRTITLAQVKRPLTGILTSAKLRLPLSVT